MIPNSSAVSASDPARRSLRRRLVDQRVTRPQNRRALITDLIVAVVTMVVIGFPFVLHQDLSWNFSWGIFVTWSLVFVALVVRRLAPWTAFVLAIAGFLVKILLGEPPHGSDLGILIIWFSSAAVGSRLLLVTSGVAALICPAILGAHLALFPYDIFLLGTLTGSGRYSLSAFLLYAALLGLVFVLISLLFWSFGLVQRIQVGARDASHAVDYAALENRRTREQLVVEQERNQIARDMHDVIAHSLAVVVAQADGGRYIARQDPGAAEEVLGTIAETSREALTDVRGLLGQLRHSQHDTQHKRLDDLGTVVDRLRAAGLDVRVTSTGRRQPIGAPAEVAVFRLVQESLTNALKYGDRRWPTLLEIVWCDGMRIRVRNHIAPVPNVAAGSGHGLIGMRERLLVVGGSVTAAPVGVEFIVEARVPLASDPRTTVPGVPHAESLPDAAAPSVGGSVSGPAAPVPPAEAATPPTATETRTP